MKTNKSTFDRMMEDPKWKADFDKGYYCQFFVNLDLS